jgi:hypothetical protein
MDQKPHTPPKARHLTADNLDRKVQVLALEYQTLRQEVLVRIAGRFQFLGLMTTAAAILASGFFGHSIFGSQAWISLVLAAGVFGFGLLCYLLLGHHIIRTSTRLAQIEARINALVPAESDVSPPLLSWESERQNLRFRMLFLLADSPSRT